MLLALHGQVVHAGHFWGFPLVLINMVVTHQPLPLVHHPLCPRQLLPLFLQFRPVGRGWDGSSMEYQILTLLIMWVQKVGHFNPIYTTLYHKLNIAKF